MGSVRKRYRMPVHWLGDDGRWHLISWQGSVLKWKVLREPEVRKDMVGRGKIVAFTPASRFRMLQLVSTVDWYAAVPGVFITLTYPTGWYRWKKGVINIHRYLFARWLEGRVGEAHPILWRIELEDRKSGDEKGVVYPHLHMIVFRLQYVHFDEVNAAWKKIIHHEGYLRTETKGLKNRQMAGYYLSKYLAASGPFSLVIPPYLNNSFGRHWGLLRPKLLPRCDKLSERFEDDDHIRLAREYAKDLAPDFVGTDNSFTLLGDKAVELARFIFGPDVDRIEGEL